MRPPVMRGVISSLAMFCTVIAATAAASAQETVTRYVMADVVRVRAAPEKGANVIANLRIATPVKVAYDGTAPEGWAKVLLDTRQPLTGYAASSFLGAEMPKAADLLARYDASVAAGDLKDARTAAERLVALEPGKDEHLERLKTVYLKLGDADGAQRIESYLNGGGIKYIGSCGGKLLAAYQPGQGFIPWMGGTKATIRGDLTNGLLALQRSPWFRFGVRSLRSRALHGTFALNANPLGAGSWIDLPACEGTDILLSNEPMEALSFEPAARPGARDIVEKQLAQEGHQTGFQIDSLNDIQFDSLNARVIPGPRPLLTARFKIAGHVNFWTLFDQPTGRLLAQHGWYSPAARDIYASVLSVTWFKWRRSDVRVAIVYYNWDSDDAKAGGKIVLYVIEADNRVHQGNVAMTWSIEPGSDTPFGR